MSHFDEEELSKLMQLCRIQCDDEEKQALKISLSRIISYLDELTNIDVEGVEAVYSVLNERTMPLRQDVEDDLLAQEDFLANAPSHIGGMIRIPSVLKGGG
jgi:aspartyl-tRNA(Asn)/glutamyl-tRNA(Gln) amidotransferase subunit C